MNLTNEEKQLLEVFNADKTMYEAVQKIVKGRIEKERDAFIRIKTNRDGKSAAEVGAQVQIFDEAILLVETIFADLRRFKKTIDIPNVNPGR
jgi:hypothetical protein